MSIQVVPIPAQLAWPQFKVVDSIPHGEDAHTDLNFILPHTNFRLVSGKYMLADNLRMTVSPIIKVLKGANQTADLLAHEQGHYNIGILVGRAMARELEALSSASAQALATAASKAFDRHRLTLMPVVQDDYDTKTKHGLDPKEQTNWNGLIASGLAATVCAKLNNHDL